MKSQYEFVFGGEWHAENPERRIQHDIATGMSVRRVLRSVHSPP
jgi:hypothetical protein